ncbi:hypothetical protein [Pseudoxanthomonas sp. SGT-18]|uniref:hypothetical protein n=1 Tax=Pseudoxanthomonas sp. SGT-18 TaxID=2493087 RepID=UPI00197E73EE|nr:hypothetical protein [Pseudoxanthomonas sp. SGT-18]
MATKKPCTVSSRVLLSWVDLVVHLGDAGLIAQHFRQWHGARWAILRSTAVAFMVDYEENHNYEFPHNSPVGLSAAGL